MPARAGSPEHFLLLVACAGPEPHSMLQQNAPCFSPIDGYGSCGRGGGLSGAGDAPGGCWMFRKLACLAALLIGGTCLLLSVYSSTETEALPLLPAGLLLADYAEEAWP